MSIARIHFCLAALLLAGCAAKPANSTDYNALRSQNPRSILIVPVVNKSVDVDASDYFLSTISRPFADRGYYVFPVNLVKKVMDDDGLSDADMVRANDTPTLARLFGADSVLYVSIDRWDAKYVLISTTVTVELDYTLKSGSTGEQLWQNHVVMSYQPQGANAGNPLASLIADAIIAAVQKAKPNYIPLARQANAMAVITPHKGLPAGPYNELYQKDQDTY